MPSSGEYQSFLLRNYLDEPTHTLEGNLFTKSTDLNVNHILKIPLQQHLNWTKNHGLAKSI